MSAAKKTQNHKPVNAEPKVAVVILAHNEQERLPHTLRALSSQSLLKRKDVEVVIVANGCADDTAATSQRFIDEHSLAPQFRVVDLPEKGKTNAWNRFVNDFSNPATESFVFADADIEFLTEDTLEKMIAPLAEPNPPLASCGDTFKDLERRPPRNWVERLSAAFSTLNRRRGGVLLSGQLYAIRADVARRIHMPLGCVAEDGYLKHLLVSNGFREQPNDDYVRYVPGVGNVFEGYLSWRDIIATQVRIRIGEVQIFVLTNDVRAKVAANPDLPWEQFADEDRIEGPQWLAQLMAKHLQRRGWWVMFPGAVTNRLRWLGRLPWGRRIKSLPLALVGTAADLWLSLLANRKIKRQGTGGDALWTQVRTTSNSAGDDSAGKAPNPPPADEHRGGEPREVVGASSEKGK